MSASVIGNIADRKVVQDGEREETMRTLFGLDRPAKEHREGVDAVLNPGGIEFELKSTSKASVSTARDFGPRHIEKWERRYWLVGCGSNSTAGFHFDAFYALAPEHMARWYDRHRRNFEDADTLRHKVDAELANSGSFTLLERASVLRRLIRGSTLNDPQIEMAVVREGKLIETAGRAPSELACELHAFVERFPMRDKVSVPAVLAGPGAEFFRFGG